MNIPAYLVLRFIAITLVIIGIASISVATSYALSTEIVFVKDGLIMLIIGVFLILIAGVGPLRVMLYGAQIPIEIKRMIAIQAVLLPLRCEFYLGWHLGFNRVWGMGVFNYWHLRFHLGIGWILFFKQNTSRYILYQ